MVREGKMRERFKLRISFGTENVSLCSASARVGDSEERVDGEQSDSPLVGPGPASLHHPAVPAALL